jgi:hypothetical protein
MLASGGGEGVFATAGGREDRVSYEVMPRSKQAKPESIRFNGTYRNILKKSDGRSSEIGTKPLRRLAGSPSWARWDDACPTTDDVTGSRLDRTKPECFRKEGPYRNISKSQTGWPRLRRSNDTSTCWDCCDARAHCRPARLVLCLKRTSLAASHVGSQGSGTANNLELAPARSELAAAVYPQPSNEASLRHRGVPWTSA